MYIRLVFYFMPIRNLIITDDGSHTIYDPVMGSHFHSIHGAITESSHVFIKHGLETLLKTRKVLRIFEMGFGTGLNAYLSLLISQKADVLIYYDAIEVAPLEWELVRELNYSEKLTGIKEDTQFLSFHTCEWNKQIKHDAHFYFCKMLSSWESFMNAEFYDLVFFDAFDPVCQAELWNIESCNKLFNMMAPDSILCTYCAKGLFRRNLITAGFIVEKLPGPPGKREMTRAIKPAIS